MMYLFLTYTQFFTLQDINRWTGVDYCDVFISCLDSHSDGTHSLQRIHWWVGEVMLNFSKTALMKNKLIDILDDLTVSTFVLFINYSFMNLSRIALQNILTNLTFILVNLLTSFLRRSSVYYPRIQWRTDVVVIRKRNQAYVTNLIYK